MQAEKDPAVLQKFHQLQPEKIKEESKLIKADRFKEKGGKKRIHYNTLQAFESVCWKKKREKKEGSKRKLNALRQRNHAIGNYDSRKCSNPRCSTITLYSAKRRSSYQNLFLVSLPKCPKFSSVSRPNCLNFSSVSLPKGPSCFLGSLPS